ncbi:MAG: AsmA family protein, partial [Snodgrassella sp.]|nr:AsmA family protein [Snodgrassella sp.]
MISLLHSGKFWLKLVVFSCLSIISLLIIDMIVLHYLFNAEEINKRANALVAESGRQVIFDSDISRSMFPRPTVTLHQVHIRDKATKTDDISIGNMKIGLGWQSLFGRLTIEKLQLTDAHISLTRNNQGQWNLADLWKKP